MRAAVVPTKRATRFRYAADTAEIGLAVRYAAVSQAASPIFKLHIVAAVKPVANAAAVKRAKNPAANDKAPSDSFNVCTKATNTRERQSYLTKLHDAWAGNSSTAENYQQFRNADQELNQPKRERFSP